MTAVLSVYDDDELPDDLTIEERYIRGQNGRLIAEVARLWIKPDDLVLDLTYGRGLFWTAFRPERLSTNDIDPDKTTDYTADYRDAEAWRPFTGLFDVVVFDPPYISTGPSAKSTLAVKASAHGTSDFRHRYGLASTARGFDSVFADVAAGMEIGATLLTPGGRLMVKCCDYVESGHRRWARRHVVEVGTLLGLEQVDEFVHHSGTGPQPLTNRDGTPRRQIHSRRAHSFLCIFEKPKTRKKTK